MTIREAEPDELDTILELYQDLHSVDAPLPEEEKLHKAWEEIISSPIVKLFVAESGNKIVASCTLTMIPNLTRGCKPYGLIENVVTRQTHRNKGIGKSILKFALGFAWQCDCYKVMLLTGRKEEWVTRFYESVGFQSGEKLGFVDYPSVKTERD